MKAKLNDQEIKKITEKANQIIDNHGWFVHIKEWHTRIIIEALKKCQK